IAFSLSQAGIPEALTAPRIGERKPIAAGEPMSRVQVNDPRRPLSGPRKIAARLTPIGAGWLLPAVLSTTAGAMDVIGFLALGGLFTAHITGNVVILAAHYVVGGFSEVGPLLSVPVFIAVLGAVTLASGAIEKVGYSSRRSLLVLQAALLAACLGLGVGFGPFADPDRPSGAVTGPPSRSPCSTWLSVLSRRPA